MFQKQQTGLRALRAAGIAFALMGFASQSAMAQEAADFSRKSLEKGTAAIEKLTAAKSFDKALEAQQAFAKESYDAMVSQMTKMNELYLNTAKEAFKPFEASFAAFGVKAPK